MSTSPPSRPPQLAWKWPINAEDKMASVAPVAPRPGRVAVQTLVPAVAAGLFFLRHARVMGWVALGVCGWMLFSALLLPRAFPAVERALKAFGRLVGLGLTWVLLVAFFFLCLFPLGLILRRRARVLLALGFDKDQPTYWLDRAPVSGTEHFQKQY
jgi:hypothetical protein